MPYYNKITLFCSLHINISVKCPVKTDIFTHANRPIFICGCTVDLGLIISVGYMHGDIYLIELYTQLKNHLVAR